MSWPSRPGPWHSFYLKSLSTALHHRHHIHRLRLPAHAAGKICNVLNFGLPTAESRQLSWGQLLVNLYISPKLILWPFLRSLYASDLYALHPIGFPSIRLFLCTPLCKPALYCTPLCTPALYCTPLYSPSSPSKACVLIIDLLAGFSYFSYSLINIQNSRSKWFWNWATVLWVKKNIQLNSKSQLLQLFQCPMCW